MRSPGWQPAAVYSALAVASLLVMLPVAWMFTVSIRPNGMIFTVPPRWVPAVLTLEAYRRVLGSPATLRFFFNSYVVAGTTTVASLALAMMAGYGFSRFRFPGASALRVFIIGTQMIPPIALVVPYFVVIAALGLYDSYTALIATYTSFALPFATLMMTSYFDTIPRDLEEAAMVDGCTRLGALRRILAPLTVPGVVATGAFAFLLAWNEFLFAVTLTQTTSMRTVPVGIALLMGEHAYQWNVMMALSLLASLPLFAVFVFVQRYLIAGLAAGAVKG